MEEKSGVYTEAELDNRRKWPRYRLLEEVKVVSWELDQAKERMERFKKHGAKHGWIPRGYQPTETEIKLRKTDLAMLREELNRR